MREGNKLILAFVTLIIGAVLITTIATQGLAVTERNTVFDESISIASTRIPGIIDINETAANLTLPTANQLAWKQDDCPIASVVVTNSTGDTTFILNTDYQVDLSLATIHMLNTTSTQENASNNLTYIDYTYCGDDYMNLTWGRTLLNLVGGFFAIALLAISVGLFYSVAKDNGIA